MFLRCLVVAVAAAVSLSLCGAIAPERICGPFPILSVPYCEDGSLDTDTLLKEAEFVADCGVNGFIWAQSNDAIDLLTVDERKASFMALAKAFEGHDTIVALGCQGRNTADMEELARHVESLAAKHPSANLAIVSRPPHDARTQDDIERYYRALAKIAKRPVIIQTYTSDKVPVPDSSLLIRLAREYPSVYGWIKEETGGADANARMVAETSAPEIKTVFSAWGSYGWLDQFRRFGTRGVISERAGYADVMMNIWRALERGDSSQADSAFAQYLFMMNLKETVPGGHLRGFNLYILKKRGIFKNFVSREYADEDKTPGRWKLETRVFSPDEAAEIDRRFECLKPFFDTPKETKVYVRSVKIEDGENWWGAANFFGTNMPFTAKTDLKIDLRRRNYSNQCASLLVSDRGRAIWSDAQSEITFKNGTLTIDADSPVFVETATEPTLRGAYLHAMRKWFPPSGKSPDASFFTAPQLNTWIELTYHQNQKDVLSYARSMLEHGVPPGVLMIDDTWQAGYGDWRFEPSRFPDPKGMIDELHAMAYKVMLWMCPYVGMDLPAFRRIAWGQNPDDVHGYPVRGGFLADVSDAVPGEGEYDFKDKPKACGWWNGYSAFLDFSHPNANAWFTETLDGLVKDYGVDGFKFDGADLGAYNLSDRRAHDPKATSGSLNNGYCAYALRYPFCEIRNTWRMQQAPVVVRLHDKMHEWSALNRIVADMIAAGLIGQPFICPDMVGGGDWMAFIPGSPFEQELFIRSAEIHALCPMMQISASPWRVLDERHQAIFSEILALRQKFAPMIAALAKKAGEDGEPILRSLEYVYPGQGYAGVIDEFMMGEDLLVAPVLTKGANSREVVLPPGRWRDASGVIHAGPVRIMVDAPLGHLPHFVRATDESAALSQDSNAELLASARKSEEKDLAAHPNTWGWDKYGGWSFGPEQKATGAYRVEKVNGKWWLVAPNGRLVWSHGLVGVAYPDEVVLCGKYGSRASFAEASHLRVRSWGFNAIGAGSDSGICSLGKTAYAAKNASNGEEMNFGNMEDIAWIDGCDGEKPLKEILPARLDKPVIFSNVKFGAKDQAKKYVKFVRAAMAHPAVVGVHACRFADDGDDSHLACTDAGDAPKSDVIAAAREVGYKIYETRWNAAGDDMHPDLIGYRRCIPMEGFLRTDPGLNQIGLFRTRDSAEIKSSRWSVGCECLDRDFGDFERYKGYLGKTGAKRARFQSGWAKTEKTKGNYDFEWLDRHLRYAVSVGVKPWVCIAYGNPIYKSDLNIGTGVATVVENPETLEAWLNYCRALVARYGDIVDEWEVWNEPFGKQMDEYYKMLVLTSEAIHALQPHAKIMVSAVGTVDNAKTLLAKFVAEKKTDVIQCWHIHPYIANPDKKSDEWWGLDCVDEFRDLLAKANPNIRLVQGETGCPAQLEYTHALALRSWSEYSQAKWDLRSMAEYAARGIPYSVFSIVDNKYADMLQSFGMLRANLHRGVVYARPKYFACQNMFSFFDDEVKPMGIVKADFEILERNIPQFDMPSRDKPSEYAVPYEVNVARFEKKGSPVLLAWYSHRIPSDALVFDTVKFSVPGVSFKDPVWMDMVTGRVFEIDSKDIEIRDGTAVFKRLPIWDSPVLLAERGNVELKL